ncbi:hypothetical protein ILYODFUR_003700 [Ilyodon furcidens]|uniref:Uncharacterized protein n=1 Tax=Ilyodon furcidens TaxID=33524 RepID=A0ABV0SKP5_9TELE
MLAHWSKLFSLQSHTNTDLGAVLLAGGWYIINVLLGRRLMSGWEVILAFLGFHWVVHINLSNSSGNNHLHTAAQEQNTQLRLKIRKIINHIIFYCNTSNSLSNRRRENLTE